MKRQAGSTMFELITVICIVGIFAAIAVPGAAHVRSAVSSAEGARRLAIVLRASQAEAQSRSAAVRIEVGPDGDYTVTGPEGDRIMSGRLGAAVTSNYPDGDHRVHRTRVGAPAWSKQSARGALQHRRGVWICHRRGATVGVRAMHVKARIGRPRARRRSSGFSLVEVVVASGLLLMTITAVTFCVTSVSASGARLQRVMDADRAVRLVAERLAAMPFYGSGADAGAASGLGGRRSSRAPCSPTPTRRGTRRPRATCTPMGKRRRQDRS